ncbi:dynein light chain [Vairimorpha necatrix]|uniref:Dynein light chain n=1 Tax=Vairimorpha necatrix TaxID=6039 RepID=A0AAX4JDD7_9MICR
MAKIEEEKSKIEEEVKFSDNRDFPEEIKKKIISELKGKTRNLEPTKVGSCLKMMLDRNFGSGWCVIIGGHFSGAFTYVGSLYIEITVREIVIVIFKTYKPDKN